MEKLKQEREDRKRRAAEGDISLSKHEEEKGDSGKGKPTLNATYESESLFNSTHFTLNIRNRSASYGQRS